MLAGALSDPTIRYSDIRLKRVSKIETFLACRLNGKYGGSSETGWGKIIAEPRPASISFRIFFLFSSIIPIVLTSQSRIEVSQTGQVSHRKCFLHSGQGLKICLSLGERYPQLHRYWPINSTVWPQPGQTASGIRYS